MQIPHNFRESSPLTYAPEAAKQLTPPKLHADLKSLIPNQHKTLALLNCEGWAFRFLDACAVHVQMST